MRVRCLAIGRERRLGACAAQGFLASRLSSPTPAAVRRPAALTHRRGPLGASLPVRPPGHARGTASGPLCGAEPLSRAGSVARTRSRCRRRRLFRQVREQTRERAEDGGFTPQTSQTRDCRTASERASAFAAFRHGAEQ